MLGTTERSAWWAVDEATERFNAGSAVGMGLPCPSAATTC